MKDFLKQCFMILCISATAASVLMISTKPISTKSHRNVTMVTESAVATITTTGFCYVPEYNLENIELRSCNDFAFSTNALDWTKVVCESETYFKYTTNPTSFFSNDKLMQTTSVTFTSWSSGPCTLIMYKTPEMKSHYIVDTPGEYEIHFTKGVVFNLEIAKDKTDCKVGFRRVNKDVKTSKEPIEKDIPN